MSPRIFYAYGVRVESDFDLSHHLVEKVNGPSQIRVSHLTDPVTIQDEWLQLASVVTHGRRITAWTDHDRKEMHSGQRLKLHIDGVCTFHTVNGDRDLYYELGDGGELEQLEFWLVHLAIPVMLAAVSATAVSHP